MLSKALVCAEFKDECNLTVKSLQLIYEISPEMGEHIFQWKLWTLNGDS